MLYASGKKFKDELQVYIIENKSLSIEDEGISTIKILTIPYMMLDCFGV